MNKIEFQTKLNGWGRDRVPFLFLVDFEIEKPLAFKLSEVDPKDILFYTDGFTNATNHNESNENQDLTFSKRLISANEYKIKFDFVKARLLYGDSFLTNLTIKTAISSNHSLRQLYSISKAKYKLLYRDEFLMFSPETFVKIKDGKIYSYPMKGTIDLSVENAREVILSDPKEMAEHTTIVDLIRNDLSLVATNVKVTKFRYLDEIKTTTKTLLQVSSEIQGQLVSNFCANLGNIIVSLLPAGSVSGAPKMKTLEIIRQVESEARGYYTGVFGYFDGESLDSCVMIRFIENQANQLYYRSGGGITAQSEIDKEYQEAIDKIYVPID